MALVVARRKQLLGRYVIGPKDRNVAESMSGGRCTVMSAVDFRRLIEEMTSWMSKLKR
jgi:hypothetical protein